MTEDGYPVGLADAATERDLIGGLLRTPGLVPVVAALLDSSQAITQTRLAAAYDAVLSVFSTGSDVTLSRVRATMHTDGDLDPGLSAWLADLLRDAPLLEEDVRAAAERVRALASKRRIEFALTKATAFVRSPAASDAEALDTIHSTMSALLTDAPIGEALHLGTRVVEETIDRIEAAGRREGLPGLSTGSADLDDTLQGLRPGQLIVVGGRPSVGKSVVAVDWLRAIAHQAVGTMLFTLEMSRHDITKRVLSAEGVVNYLRVMNGKLSDDEWLRLSRAQQSLPFEKVAIVDEPGLAVAQISALATQQARIWESHSITPGAILIDYLQIMRQTDPKASRQVALGEITVELKTLAKRLGVPIVLLSQVGRGSEQNAMKLPSMSDLRESGDIENNADVVILLHRPDLYDVEERPGEIDFIVAKNREGVTKTVTRTHQYRYSRITDMAHTAV